MGYCFASYSKGQLKIQEMAFVLVAIMIFFAIVALFYITIRTNTLRDDAGLQREEEAKELVRKLSDSPEFSWTASSCSNCIDLDKVMALKDKPEYKNFWNIDYLMVEIVYPAKNGVECGRGNYPDCSTITLVNKTIGTPITAFVAVCRQEFRQRGYPICELGRLYASGKALQ